MTDKLPSEMPLEQLKRYSRYIKDLIAQREAEELKEELA